MLKNIGENDNIIYGDLSKQLNFKCDFKGKNNNFKNKKGATISGRFAKAV